MFHDWLCRLRRVVAHGLISSRATGADPRGMVDLFLSVVTARHLRERENFLTIPGNFGPIALDKASRGATDFGC